MSCIRRLGKSEDVTGWGDAIFIERPVESVIEAGLQETIVGALFQAGENKVAHHAARESVPLPSHVERRSTRLFPG